MNSDINGTDPGRAPHEANSNSQEIETVSEATTEATPAAKSTPLPAGASTVHGVSASTEQPALLSAQAATPGPTTAAFFDVDNTIIRGASSFHLAKALYKRGFFRTRDIIEFGIKQSKYMLIGENQKDISDVKSRALDLMRGHSVAEVLAVGEEVYDQVLSHRIYEGTRKLLDQHLAAGHQVWLVTATPSEIGDLIARRLGVTGALTTNAESQDGIYTGRLVGDMMHGQAKADAVLELAAENDIVLAGSFAYGDSTNDIPLLNSVGNPCAINPDPRMRRHAQEVGWPTRDFRAKRKAARRSVQTASVTGGVWVLALVVKRLRNKLAGK